MSTVKNPVASKEELKNVLFTLLVNHVDNSLLSELKTLAVDYILNNNHLKHLIGNTYVRYNRYYLNDKTKESFEKDLSQRNILNVDIEESWERFEKFDSNYYSVEDEIQVLDVDIFNKSPFFCKILRTGELISLEKLPNEKNINLCTLSFKEEIQPLHTTIENVLV